MDLTLRVLGVVRSPLTDPATAPRFETENAPQAELVLDPAYRAATKSLTVGQEILVFTWLHLANRACLEVHPRRDHTRPLTGVFNTRSPDRPNPIGLHRVRIMCFWWDKPKCPAPARPNICKNILIKNTGVTCGPFSKSPMKTPYAGCGGNAPRQVTFPVLFGR